MAETFRRRQRADVRGLMSAVLAFIGRFLGSLVKFVLVPSRRVTYTISHRQRVNRLIAQPAVLAIVGLPRRRQDGDRQHDKTNRNDSEVVPLRPTFHLNTSFLSRARVSRHPPRRKRNGVFQSPRLRIGIAKCPSKNIVMKHATCAYYTRSAITVLRFYSNLWRSLS